MAMWHPSNFFNIQSSIDSLSDKFTQLQSNHQTLLLKCQQDCSKAVSQGISSDSSFQVLMNNEKDVINSGLQHLSALGKQYNKETLNLKDLIAQDYNNVKPSSSANLKNQTNPVDSLRSFVESNFESIKAKIFFLDGIEKLDATAMKHLEEHFDGAQKSVSAALSNFCNIQKKALAKKSHIDISQIEHYCSVNFLTIDSLNSNLGSLAKDIVNYSSEFNSLLVSYKKESHILQEGLNHVKQQIYTMTKEGQDNKSAGGRPSTSMKHERPPKGSNIQKELLALDQLVAQAIAANIYKNTAFNALKETIETQQVQLAKRVDDFAVEIGMIKEANGAIVETISQSQKLRTPNRTKASHKSREGTPEGGGKKKSLSPGLKSYINKMSPFDNTQKLQRFSPPARKKSPQTQPCSARIRNASEEKLTQNSELLSQTALFNETSKTALTKYGKDIDKLRKELKRNKKQYEDYVVSLNDKAKKIEGCIRKLLVSAGKIGAASSKKTDEDIFLFKAFQHDYKLLEDKLNKLFVCKESSPLKETANTRSMSQDVSRYRSRHLDLSGNRTATKDDEKKSKKALIASHGKGDKKLSDMLDEFEKKQSLLLSTLEADKEPLSSDRYLKSEEKVKDRRHENKTFKSEADQFRREFSRDRKSSEQNRKERERSRLESSSLFEDEKERKAHKEALINEKKMKQVMEENEIVKREISDLKEKTKRIQNKAEERKKTLKQLFDLVVEKDKELNNYKEALRRNDHQVKRNRDEIENKIEEHMTLFIAAFEELDKQLTGKETKLNNIEEILGEVLKSRTEKSSLKIENASGQKVKLKSLEKRRKKLEELINVIDMSIVNKSSKELEYVKEFLSQEKDDLAAGTGLRQDVVAYQVDEDVKFSKNPKFNETIKLQDLKTKIEKGDLNLLDAKVGGRSKRPKALELDEFDAKQAYKLGREEPKENRSMASEHMKTGNNSIVTEEHEAITKKIDQLFDGLRGDVESYRMSGNKRQENVQRSETNTEKEISDKDTSSEGGMVGRIAAIGMPPRPDGGESAKKASIQEIESAFHSVKVLKDEIEILKAEKAQEEKLFKDENRSLKNLVDFVNQRVDLIYEWLKDGTDYKNWAVSDKVRNLRDILQQREEDKTEELENAKAQLEELLIQERQKFKAKKASAEQKAHERKEQIKLKVISLETSNAELQSAIEACKKEILAKAQENKQMTQEIESKDNQIKSLEEHLLQAKSSEQDQQKFDAVLTSLDDHLSSLINKHAGSQVQNETEDNEVAVQDRIRRRITQIEFCLQQKHQESELLRRENSETKKQADKLKRDKEELEKLIKHKENAVFATLNQYEKLEDEANNLVEANSKLEAALRKTEQDLQKRKVEVSNSSEEVEKLKQALERANDNNNSLEKRIKEENSEIQKARLVTEEEKNKNEQEIKTLIKEKILLEEEKRSLEQVLQEVKKKLSVVNGDLETIKQQEAGLKNILTEQEKVVNEKIKALTETEKMCTNLTGALDSLQVQYNELNEVNKELESYIEELRAQIDRLTHQKEEMRIEKERMNEESSSTIDQVTRKMAEYQQNVRLLEEKLRVSLVQKEELVKEIEGGNTDVLNAKELLNNKEQELQKLTKEKESFEKERIEKEKQLLTVKEEIESIKVIFNKREKEIKKLLETNSTLEKDAKTLNETKKDLENQKSGLEEKLRLAQTDLETIKREHGDVQEQVKISSNKIKELAQELERERNNFKTGDQNLREAIQQKNKQIEEVSATNDHLTESLAFLNRDKDELVNRVHNLEENIRQYEDKNQALKKAFELQEHTVANLKENLQKETENAAQASREAGEQIKALGDEVNDLKKTKQELISSVKSFEAEVGELERLLKEEKQTQSDVLKTKQEHIAKLEGEIQNLREENDRKHKELKVSQESIITLNTNVDSLKEEVNKLQKENSDVKQNLLQKEKAMSDIEQILKSEIQKQVNDIKDKESLIAQLRSEIEEVRREIRDKDEKIVELRETIQKETNVIAKENDDLQESVRTKERQIEDLTKQKETLQNQINLLESQAAENQANHEKQIQSWRQKQEIINQEIVAKEKEYGLLQEKLNEAERSYNEVNTQRIGLENKVQGLEQEVHRLSEEMRGHENQNTESQRENKRIEFELNEANRRVRELESRIELFVKEKEELASQLSVSQSQITQSENMLNESNAQLQVSLNEKEGKIKGLEEQYTKAMKILESQQHRLASEEEKCHALEESISIKEGELEELRKQNQIISEQLHVEENKLRESREAGNKESDTLVNENAELREENKRKDEQIHAIQTENDELKENMQKMLADTEHNKASSEKEIENLKGSLVKLEEKNTNIEDEFLSLTNENENLTMANNNRVSKLTEMEQLLKSKEATYKINLENIQKEVVILTEQILAFKSQADENNQLKTENENLKAQVNEISSLKNEVNTLKERLKFEKENLDQLAEENRQLSSRVRQTGSDSIEGARALKEQINQLNQGILSQNEQIETLQREKEEIAKELNLFKIETEIKEREKDAEIQALKDELNDQDSEEGIEFADLKNDFAAKEKDWQAQREAFKNELAKITTKNQESFRNPFEAEKRESNSSKPSSFVEKPEENVEKIAELEEKLAQMEKALKELDEENKSLRLASPQIQATNEGRGFDVKQEDNKEISFSVPNEADDLKARIFLEEQDSFAEKNREKNLSNGADIEEYVRSLHEKNRKLQDENDELQQQNRLLKRENDMAKVFDQDFKSELREKDEEMDRMQFQMTLLKEELSKADKQKASMTIQPAAEPASVNIAHEKEHIRTIFCKFMNVLLQGNAKDSEELLKLLLSLLELNETSKNQVLTSFKAKAQKKGMLGKLF